MTDFTSDTGHIGSPVGDAVARLRHAPPRREYYAYFTLIFLATLPLAFLTWGLSAARRLEWPEKGPVARAWSQARIITPQIFSA
jgi:PufQ cytochrome subunit